MLRAHPSTLRTSRPLLSCIRHYSTPITPPTNAKARGGPAGEGPPAATSTSAAQPFSTPLTPGPVKPVTDPAMPRSAAPLGTTLRNINYFKNRNDPTAAEDSDYPDWLWKVLDDGKKAAGESTEEAGDLYSKSKKARRIAKKRAAKLAELQALNPEKKVPISEQTVDLPFATVPNPSAGLATTAPFSRTVAALGGLGEQPLVEVKGKVVKGKSAGAGTVLRPTTVRIGEGAVQVTAEEAARARAEVKKEMRKKSRAGIKEKNFLSQM